MNCFHGKARSQLIGNTVKSGLHLPSLTHFGLTRLARAHTTHICGCELFVLNGKLKLKAQSTKITKKSHRIVCVRRVWSTNASVIESSQHPRHIRSSSRSSVSCAGAVFVLRWLSRHLWLSTINAQLGMNDVRRRLVACHFPSRPPFSTTTRCVMLHDSD